MQACYLGGVWVAISQGMPAGISALIVNLQPVLTAALASLVHERVSRAAMARSCPGLRRRACWWCGRSCSSPGTPLMLPTVLCVFALLSMTAGTLYQKRHVPQFDLRAGQAIQAIAAIVVMLPFALRLRVLPDRVERARWSGAMLWSVLVLTGGGISLIFLMLGRAGRRR